MEDEDDFVELAYFKTWIAVRNTFQQVRDPCPAWSFIQVVVVDR